METDSLQTETLGCQTGTAEETQTSPLNLVGFGFIALLTKVCTGLFYQIQMGICGAEGKL